MIEVKFTGNSLDEITVKIEDFMGSLGITPPQVAVSTEPKREPAAEAPHTPGVGAPHTPTVEELVKGMTFKPTSTSSLGDNTRVAAGDYVTFGGEQWAVRGTYRGRLIATNEAGKNDILPANECTAAAARAAASTEAPTHAPFDLNPPAQPQEPTPAPAPAQATAAPAGAKVPQSEADRISAWLTELVQNGSLTVPFVFEMLGQHGGETVGQLTVEGAQAFEKAVQSHLMSTSAAAAPTNPFGFG